MEYCFENTLVMMVGYCVIINKISALVSMLSISQVLNNGFLTPNYELKSINPLTEGVRLSTSLTPNGPR